VNVGDCFESNNVIYKVIEKSKNYKVVCEVYSKDDNWLMGISIENETRLDKMRKLSELEKELK
jgi:hypothetical protein